MTKVSEADVNVQMVSGSDDKRNIVPPKDVSRDSRSSSDNPLQELELLLSTENSSGQPDTYTSANDSESIASKKRKATMIH